MVLNDSKFWDLLLIAHRLESNLLSFDYYLIRSICAWLLIFAFISCNIVTLQIWVKAYLREFNKAFMLLTLGKILKEFANKSLGKTSYWNKKSIGKKESLQLDLRQWLDLLLNPLDPIKEYFLNDGRIW